MHHFVARPLSQKEFNHYFPKGKWNKIKEALDCEPVDLLDGSHREFVMCMTSLPADIQATVQENFPVKWIKAEIDGQMITEVEYQVLCSHFNSGHRDVHYTITMLIAQVKELLQNPVFVKRTEKSGKKFYDWGKIAAAMVCFTC